MTVSRSLGVIALLLTSCATTPSSSSVRMTTSEAAVADCQRLGELSVVSQVERNLRNDNSQQAFSGTDTLDKTWGIDARTADSLRHWAARMGADTVLLVSFKDATTKGVACRCGRS
jgi:hypothetical protein